MFRNSIEFQIEAVWGQTVANSLLISQLHAPSEADHLEDFFKMVWEASDFNFLIGFFGRGGDVY